MKKTTLSFILTLICLNFGLTQPLFKITQGGKIGYIDAQGKVIIKPLFYSGYDFSEGLAAVRLNGTYGFINETGKFVIKPDYDLATSFVNGIAEVYKNGQKLFIDKTGKIVLPSNIIGISFVDPEKIFLYTRSGKAGVFDLLTKQLLIDTIFNTISDFNNGVAVVTEYISPTKKRDRERYGVINTEGKFIVPFGKYLKIDPFHEGYAVVEIKDRRNKDGNADGVIDRNGNLLFKRPYQHNSYVNGDFNDGYAKVQLYKYWIPEEEGVISTSEKDYEGFINLKGEVVLNDTSYIYVTDFSNGRAFIQEEDKGYILIDRNFKRVGDKEFRNIQSESFENGYAIVKTDDGVGIIDTTGNFVTKSDYIGIDRSGIIDDYFFFITNEAEDNPLFGIADLKGNIISKPIIQEFDRNGFVNGLLKVIIDDKLSFINKNGAIIWQEDEKSAKTIKPLNIDFMNRGYFYACSTPRDSSVDESGGWGISHNIPKQITSDKFPKKSIAVTIDTSVIDSIDKQFFGFKLFISNTTNETITLKAQDSRLYMNLQAQNAKGEWQDIEYLPSSWCGNSYHEVALEPNAFWNFSIPKYHGEFQTKIRAKLKYIDPENIKSEKIIYSNSINGGINPGQFWIKAPYYPNSIMDPYFE